MMRLGTRTRESALEESCVFMSPFGVLGFANDTEGTSCPYLYLVTRFPILSLAVVTDWRFDRQEP